VPDDLDYEWLGWLTTNPDDWTDEDLSAARFLIANQKRVLEELHPKDVKGRRTAQNVLDVLEAALRTHLARDA
jgi:hypothetical protein